MNKSKRKIFSCKRVTAAFLLLIMLGFTAAGIGAYFAPVSVKAENAVATGHVNAGVSGLRVRTQPDTSTGDNIITVVDDSFTFDIYDTVYTSDTYYWYRIGFYLNGSYTYGYISGEFTTKDVSYSEDADFEAYLDEQGFPESYKDALRQLHAQYPKWVFVADYVNKDWNEVVENESVLGRSLIYASAKSSWKSIEPGCYDWNTGSWIELDSGGWVQASEELLEYALDPRNFLTEPYIFMFESLAYNASLQTEEGLNQIIAGTFMENSDHDLSYNGESYTYSSALMLAGRESGVSPYHLATRIIQEQGSSGYGGSISGTVPGYNGFYNYYNQGAAMSGGNSAVTNGMIYASREDASTLRPWNTRMKSIIGGAGIIGSGYIDRGQNTIYYEKFDVVSDSPYWHQYMTNVLAPRSEASNASEAYSSYTKQNTGLVFTIPVYNNMPQEACPLPDGDGDPNNLLSDLSVDNFKLTPTFSRYTTEYSLIVENSVDSVTINASAISGSADIDGTGAHSLDVGGNNIEVTVTAQNGSQRKYYINVVRKEAEPPKEPDTPETPENPDNPETPSFSTDYKLDEERGFISGITVGDNISTVLNSVNISGGATSAVYNKNGGLKNGSDIIATGDRLVITDSSGKEIAGYTFVVYGDIDGNGSVDLVEIVYIKRHLLGSSKLEGAYLEAADANRSGEVDLADIVSVKNQLLGRKLIKQD